MKLTKFFRKKDFKIDVSGKSPAIFLKSKIKIDKKIINELIKLSKLNKNINVRICMHKNRTSYIHNMVVLICKTQKFFKHTHHKSDEIYQLLRGKMKVLETINKKIVKKTNLVNSGEIYVVSKKVEHIVLPISRYTVFHEIKLKQT